MTVASAWARSDNLKGGSVSKTAAQSPGFRFIDLFAGVGGFHHALSSDPFFGKCVFASEIDSSCREIYLSTWPDMADKLFGDIRLVTGHSDGSERSSAEIDEIVPDHEVLCAGFPCQPFSKSGFQEGELDATRGTLFYDIARIVEAKSPEFLILENVRNLAGPRHKATWQTIIRTLKSLGYSVASDPLVLTPHLLSPAFDGRPQVRDRVFILARRGDVVNSGELHVSRKPETNWDPSTWQIEDYLTPDAKVEDLTSYQLRPEEHAWVSAWQSFVEGIESDHLPGFPIWVDAFTSKPQISADLPKWKANFLRHNSEFYVQNRKFLDSWLEQSWMSGRSYRISDFPPSRRKFEWQARSTQPTRKQRDLWRLAIHFRPSGIRVKPATYLPALVAINQTSVIGSRKRRITPLEASRLQGFPDSVYANTSIDDAKAYKQLGNSVNVGVVRYVAKCLFESSQRRWAMNIQSDKVKKTVRLDATNKIVRFEENRKDSLRIHAVPANHERRPRQGLPI